MSMFDMFKKKEVSTASAAKERLQLVIARQRVVINDGRSEASSIDEKLLYKIQAEVILVIRKYVNINESEVKVDVHNMPDNVEVLEVSIPISDERASV